MIVAVLIILIGVCAVAWLADRLVWRGASPEPIRFVGDDLPVVYDWRTDYPDL